MRAFLIKRLLALIPTILFATLIVFIVIRLIPGDVIDQMVSQHDIGSQEVSRKTLEKALGLDVPIYLQYLRWMERIFLHGDLGSSLWKQTPVTSLVMERLPTTFEVSLIAIIFSILLSIPIGVYSAIRQDTAGDYAGRTVSILGIAIPNFWLGTMVVIYPAFLLGLPLTLVFPLYPALLLIPAWRNRSDGAVRVLVDHLAYGAGVLAELVAR